MNILIEIFHSYVFVFFFPVASLSIVHFFQIVRSIDDPDKNPKAIDNWITSISELHRSKPPQNVHYTKTMPDIESLMQEWPPEFEEMLKTANLPSADLDCDLNEYIDIICCKLTI